MVLISLNSKLFKMNDTLYFATKRSIVNFPSSFVVQKDGLTLQSFLCISRFNIHIRIITAFFHIKNCATLAIKQLTYNPTSKNAEVIGYFEDVFLLK